MTDRNSIVCWVAMNSTGLYLAEEGYFGTYLKSPSSSARGKVDILATWKKIDILSSVRKFNALVRNGKQCISKNELYVKPVKVRISIIDELKPKKGGMK